ncbi:MAG TPA: hypothetical protein VIG24_12595 [Acidimicrobiia bacterium]
MTNTVDSATAFVIAQLRRDIADGIYEDAELLDSFSILHDYCDANDYILQAAEQFCRLPWNPDAEADHLLWQDWVDEVADAVDTLLSKQPIVV